MKESTSYDLLRSSLLILILIIAIYFAANLIFPIVLSVFIVISLKEVMNWFDSKKVPAPLSALIVTLSLSALFILLIVFLVVEGFELTTSIDGISEKKTHDTIQYLTKIAEDKFAVSGNELDGPLKSAASSVFSISGKVLSIVFQGIQSALIFLSLIPIYVYFMLTFRHRADKFIKLNYDFKREAKIRGIIDEISVSLRKYLVGLGTVILIVGILNTIGLSIIGLDFALFLGFTTALLMIIPYIGVLIGAIIPSLLALVTMDSPWYALIVLGMYVVIQFVEGNYITPKIVGGSVNLNPLTIIIGMVVFGMIGGTLALILAVPMLAAIRILISHSKKYHHVAVLMQNDD